MAAKYVRGSGKAGDYHAHCTMKRTAAGDAWGLCNVSRLKTHTSIPCTPLLTFSHPTKSTRQREQKYFRLAF